MNWRRCSVAALWGLPVGAAWVAELAARDLMPRETDAVGLLTAMASLLTIGGPTVAAAGWRGSGLAGVIVGTLIGIFAAWTAYGAAAPSLSPDPISDYELGWTAAATFALAGVGLVTGLMAWAVVLLVGPGGARGRST